MQNAVQTINCVCVVFRSVVLAPTTKNPGSNLGIRIFSVGSVDVITEAYSVSAYCLNLTQHLHLRDAEFGKLGKNN